jgi:hypothetical protein
MAPTNLLFETDLRKRASAAQWRRLNEALVAESERLPSSVRALREMSAMRWLCQRLFLADSRASPRSLKAALEMEGR